MIPSSYQKNIFDFIRKYDGNLLVNATAGSGKTTTMIKALDIVPKNKKVLFCSFSNAIVNELKERVPSHIKATTLHSLGYGTINQSFGFYKLDKNKYFKIALEKYYNGNKARNKEIFKKCYEIEHLVQFIRNTLTPINFEAGVQMCLYYALPFDKDTLSYALHIVKHIKIDDNTIDFTDMIYYPVRFKEKIKFTRYDFIFYDEVQDANKCQIKLIELYLSDWSRLISVGDPYQQLYGFTGADIESMNYLLARPNTSQLPLSVCYRCGKTIIELAKTVGSSINYQPQIEAFEGSGDGEYRDGKVDEITENDVVVSRNTKPLIALFFQLLEKGVKAKVIGKDYEQGLQSLVVRIEFCRNVYEVKQKMAEMEQNLIDDLLAYGVIKPLEHDRYLIFQEQTKIILIVLENCTIDQLSDYISDIFNEKKPGVRLMTIHRSKGLENSRVFMIQKCDGNQMLPSKYAQLEWQIKQEFHLEFVAYTRAKESLIFIPNIITESF